MGEYYSQLQGKYLAVKSKMVEALEGQHCTEATARDLKQVMLPFYVLYCIEIEYMYMYVYIQNVTGLFGRYIHVHALVK